MIERRAVSQLMYWLEGERRKPLLLRGARQTGKTTAVRMLAEKSKRELVEINMEKPRKFQATLASMNPRKVIEAIEFELGRDIHAEKSLLFFDEVQECPEILALLRYFYEEIPDLPVIVTGSLLEFTLADTSYSMPVGRIELMNMEPLSFEEYLGSQNRSRMLQFLSGFHPGDVVPPEIHAQLTEQMRIYSIIGGMPEVVQAYSVHHDLRMAEDIKAQLIQTFKLDFNKYLGKTDVNLLSQIFDGIPREVGRKIVYSRLQSTRQAGEVAAALEQLNMAKLITRVYNTAANGIPLSAEIKPKYFKTIALDIGLLLTQLQINPIDVEQVDDLNLINSGALAEQFIGQTLRALFTSHQDHHLHYWAREKQAASSEVDYLVVDDKPKIVPVEVKSGSTGKMRSLQVLMAEKSLDFAVRFNSDPPSLLEESRITSKGKVDFRLLSLPHYMACQFKRILSQLS